MAKNKRKNAKKIRRNKKKSMPPKKLYTKQNSILKNKKKWGVSGAIILAVIGYGLSFFLGIKGDDTTKSEHNHTRSEIKGDIAALNENVISLKLQYSQCDEVKEELGLDNKEAEKSLCENLEKVQKLLLEKKYDEADSIVKALITIYPSSLKMLKNYAYISYMQGEYSGAINGLRAVLKQDSIHYDAMIDISNFFLSMGRIDSSVYYLEHAITQYPDSIEHYTNLGYIYHEMGNQELAEKYYNISLSKRENQALTWNNYATLLSEKGLWDSAMHFFHKAIWLDSSFYKVYYNMAYNYDAVSEFDSSIKYLKMALNIEPDYEDALEMLGGIYYNLALEKMYLGQLENSRKLYEKSLEANPDYIDTYINLAIVLDSLNEPLLAESMFDKAIKRDSQNAFVYCFLGRFVQRHGLSDSAIKLYNKAINLKPDWLQPYIDAGLYYYSTGNYKEAVNAFSRGAELDPLSSTCYQNLGAAYYKMELFQKAEQAWIKAFMLCPKCNDTENSLRDLYEWRGLSNLQIDSIFRSLAE